DLERVLALPVLPQQAREPVVDRGIGLRRERGLVLGARLGTPAARLEEVREVVAERRGIGGAIRGGAQLALERVRLAGEEREPGALEPVGRTREQAEAADELRAREPAPGEAPPLGVERARRIGQEGLALVAQLRERARAAMRVELDEPAV